MSTKRPVLYSANTWIAYLISEQFYRQKHYVWCTSYFDPRQNNLDAAVPPTSSPLEIYRDLYEQTSRGDRHSSKVEENRVGILRGANAKYNEGVITSGQKRRIVAIVDVAETRDFRPLLYVIPFQQVVKLMRDPPPEDKAHPLSDEYIIDLLPRKNFDVNEFGNRL